MCCTKEHEGLAVPPHGQWRTFFDELAGKVLDIFRQVLFFRNPKVEDHYNSKTATGRKYSTLESCREQSFLAGTHPKFGLP